jgi:hypothetical protein
VSCRTENWRLLTFDLERYFLASSLVVKVSVYKGSPSMTTTVVHLIREKSWPAPVEQAFHWDIRKANQATSSLESTR